MRGVNQERMRPVSEWLEFSGLTRMAEWQEKHHVGSVNKPASLIDRGSLFQTFRGREWVGQLANPGSSGKCQLNGVRLHLCGWQQTSPCPPVDMEKDASLYNKQSQWSDLSVDLWNNYKAVDWLNTDHFGTQNSTTTNYLAVIYFSFKFRSAF